MEQYINSQHNLFDILIHYFAIVDSYIVNKDKIIIIMNNIYCKKCNEYDDVYVLLLNRTTGRLHKICGNIISPDIFNKMSFNKFVKTIEKNNKESEIIVEKKHVEKIFSIANEYEDVVSVIRNEAIFEDKHLNELMIKSMTLSQKYFILIFDYLYKEKLLYMYKKYKDNYVYYGISRDQNKNYYYYYRNNKWIIEKDFIQIKKIMMTDICNLYREIIYFVDKKRNTNNEKKLDKLNNCIRYIYNNIILKFDKSSPLRDNLLHHINDNYKQQNIMEDNMNKRRDIMCFNNGVYDFDKMIFRKMKSDDFATFTTYYNYEKYTQKELKIIGTLNSILPNDVAKHIYEYDKDIDLLELLQNMFSSKNTYNFAINLLSVCLRRINSEGNVYIFYGPNARYLLEMLDALLGDYIQIFPSSIMDELGRDMMPKIVPFLNGKKIVVLNRESNRRNLNIPLVRTLTEPPFDSIINLFVFCEYLPVIDRRYYRDKTLWCKIKNIGCYDTLENKDLDRASSPDIRIKFLRKLIETNYIGSCDVEYNNKNPDLGNEILPNKDNYVLYR